MGLSSALLMFCDFPIVGHFECSVSQESSLDSSIYDAARINDLVMLWRLMESCVKY